MFILFIIIFFIMFYARVENFFIFFPQTAHDFHPKDMDLNYRDVYFNSEDGTGLHGWFFPLKGGRPIILFCHGNAGNISHRLDNIMRLLEKKIQVFIFDYRGYGESSGSPTEKGIYMDGRAAYDYLVRDEHFIPREIVLFGRSLGAAVAIDVALRREVRSIIIESAFSSTRDMAKTMFPLGFLSSIIPNNYNNLEKIRRLNIPKLIIHGEEDEIVPFNMGMSLFEASGEPRYFFPIKGAGHNDTYLLGGERYFQNITSFIMDSRI